jgi:Tfp pilus assembly protein PilO
VHNVKISPRRGEGAGLQLEATAKTYRYLEEAGG